LPNAAQPSGVPNRRSHRRGQEVVDVNRDTAGSAAREMPIHPCIAQQDRPSDMQSWLGAVSDTAHAEHHLPGIRHGPRRASSTDSSLVPRTQNALYAYHTHFSRQHTTRRAMIVGICDLRHTATNRTTTVRARPNRWRRLNAGLGLSGQDANEAQFCVVRLQRTTGIRNSAQLSSTRTVINV